MRTGRVSGRGTRNESRVHLRVRMPTLRFVGILRQPSGHSYGDHTPMGESESHTLDECAMDAAGIPVRFGRFDLIRTVMGTAWMREKGSDLRR